MLKHGEIINALASCDISPQEAALFVAKYESLGK